MENEELKFNQGYVNLEPFINLTLFIIFTFLGWFLLDFLFNDVGFNDYKVKTLEDCNDNDDDEGNDNNSLEGSYKEKNEGDEKELVNVKNYKNYKIRRSIISMLLLSIFGVACYLMYSDFTYLYNLFILNSKDIPCDSENLESVQDCLKAIACLANKDLRDN